MSDVNYLQEVNTKTKYKKKLLSKSNNTVDCRMSFIMYIVHEYQNGLRGNKIGQKNVIAFCHRMDKILEPGLFSLLRPKATTHWLKSCNFL